MSGAVRRGPRGAEARLRRLLVMLPWLLEQGGPVRLVDMATRFQLTVNELTRDLELASLCGLPPYTDEMIDLYVEDGWVYPGIPRLFTVPLRLTASEALTLVAAGRAAMEVPGAAPTGALASALAKLEAVVGNGSERVPVEVDLATPPLLGVVQHAAAHGERLAITYFSAGRGAVTDRVIAPLLVAHERGQWYVVADCSLAGPERTFRVDRIETAEPTGEHVAPRSVAPPSVADGPGEDAPLVRVRLPAEAAWVAERYPVVSAEVLADGNLEVVLRLWSTRWLERLLLRAGPAAEVIEPDGMFDLAAAARRVLAVYERR